jgi:hypothetical protein
MVAVDRVRTAVTIPVVGKVGNPLQLVSLLGFPRGFPRPPCFADSRGGVWFPQALAADRGTRPARELSPSRKMAVPSLGRRTAASPHSCDLAPRQ